MPPINLLTWLSAYKYAFIFPLTFIQGPLAMVAGGFLLRQGYFEFLPLYATLVAGDFIAEIGWYWVGFYGARPLVIRYGRFIGLAPKLFEKLEGLFKRYTARILIISKLTMGFGFALVTLITAGASKIPFRQYVLFNLIGGFFWTALLLSVGYFFGHLYLLIEKGFRLTALFAFIVLSLLILWGFQNYVRKRIMKTL